MGREPQATIARAIRGTPFQGKLWEVGGVVRDELIGLPASPDVDIVVEGDALEVGRMLWKQRVSEIAPVEYPRFGTVLLHIGGVKVEFASARTDSYRSGSRKPSVRPATLLEDALRRDLTINALFRSLETGELSDPTGHGLADLKQGVLRTPRDPSICFEEDPLRMLRAVRFRWRFGFRPAPGLWEAIRAGAEKLGFISQERIRDELCLILLGNSPDRAMKDLLDLGLLQVFAPELAAMAGVTQGHWHHADVFDHTMGVVAGIEASLPLRLAALLHDVGKPPTRFVDEQGQIRFFGHETVGAAMAEKMLRRLRCTLDTIATVKLLVKNHMRLGSSDTLSPAAARRLLRGLQGHHWDLLELVRADGSSMKTNPHKDLDAIRQALQTAETQTPRELLESPLTGEQIMKLLGLPAGPEVGRVKSELAERVVDGTLPAGDALAAEAYLRQRK